MPEAAVAAPLATSTAEASSSIAAASRSAAALGAPTGTTSGTAGKSMQDAFAKLRQAGGAEPAPEPAKKPTPPNKPTEPAKKEIPKEEPKPEEKTEPVEAKTEPEQKADTKPAEPAKPKKPSDYLREEMTRWKAKAEQLEGEVKKFKETPPAEQPEVKTLSEKLTAAEKRAKELDDIVRQVAYERHDDFKKNYDQPFLDSYSAGAAKVKALKVINPDTGEERPGTLEDWESIANARTEEEAAIRIEELFGTGVRSQMVTKHYLDAVEKFRNKQKALADSAKTADEQQAQFAEFQKKLHTEVKSLWESQIKVDAVPDQWKPYIAPKGNDAEGKPIDAEWDTALAKGYERYDKAMSEDARQPHLTTEQRKDIIGRAAAQRHQAAAFRPLVNELRKLKTQLAERDAELEAYRKTEPGAGDGEPGAETNGTAQPTTMGAALAKLQKLSGAGTPKFH